MSHRSWGQGGSFFTSEIVELLASYGLEGGSIDLSKGIPDTIATIVIKHYAYKGKKEAQQIDVVIGVIGLRVLIQQMCGYQSQIQPQPQEQTVSTWIIDRFEKLEEQINNLAVSVCRATIRPEQSKTVKAGAEPRKGKKQKPKS